MHLRVSEDFSTIYLESSEALTSEAPPVSGSNIDIYRYEISAKDLHFVTAGERYK